MNTIKKGLCLLTVLAVILSGCASGPKATEPAPVPTSPVQTEAGTEAASKPSDETETVPATEPAKTVFNDGVIGGGSGASEKGTVTEEYYAAPGAYAEVREGAADTAAPYTGFKGYRPGPEPAAGLLTAKEWCDHKNPEEFLKYIGGQQTQSLLNARQIRLDALLSVSGLSGINRLVLTDAAGVVLAQAVTDVYGTAVLPFERKAGQELILLVDGQENRITEQMLESPEFTQGRITRLSFDGHPMDLVADKLDLMFMVDTTGSMGDELEYLKKELASVVEAVYSRNPGMSIRVSVNFYRDEGDEYVVKYFDFRDDLQTAVSLIGEQSAYGGGDYPEAVHTALDNAVFGHAWREDAVKLCYLVFDAPPHREGDFIEVDEQTRKRVENIDATLEKAVKGAAEAGIRIIPVAASGADEEVEALGRFWALATGGTYIYLTNDSGIGYYHETPDVPDTKLEYLNDCLIRVTAEYCGLSYEAERIPTPSSWDYGEPPVWDQAVPDGKKTE